MVAKDPENLDADSNASVDESDAAISRIESDDSTAVAGSLTLRAAVQVEPGTVISDRYQIENVLGEGGSGTVFRAWDRMLGELVAVKILHPQRALERSWIRRLAREVRVARAIRHPNVCRVFELGQDRGRWFVTMELATGGSLRDLLRVAEGEVQTATATQLAMARARTVADRISDIRSLCAGLAAIHAVGITHRDVTPQNVLRMADGRLVLTDFGLAIERDDQTTIHGGTPAYMPPEAAHGGRSDQRSDVFQLGMIMWEILTDQRARWAPDGSHLLLPEPPPRSPIVVQELHTLIRTCVDADPNHRPPSALAVSGRLAAAEVAQPPALSTRVVTRTRRFVRGHARLLKLSAVAVVIAIVGLTVQRVSRQPLCRGAGQQLAGIWDDARAEAVRRSFVSTGAKGALGAFGRLRLTLDAYAGAWTAMYTDACEATNVRGEQSPEVLDLRMSCLKHAQVELRALTDLFSSADDETVSRALGAASELTPISTCGDISVLKAVLRPPTDRQTALHVEDVRSRLSEIKALYGAGRYKEGVRRGGPLLEEARSLGYEPLIAEVLQGYGMVLFFNHQEADTIRALDEAMVLAQGSRHDRQLAESAVMRVAFLGHLGRDADLQASVPWAEAALKRVGGDARLQSWLYNAIADDDRFMGRGEAALQMYRRALEIKQTLLGPEHWDVGLSLGNVATQLHDLGRNDEALRANERALMILEREQHPDVALHVCNRGEIRLSLGQATEALADFERAERLFDEDFPADHPYVSAALTGVGQAMLALGRTGDEVIAPLERALRIRVATPTRADDRAQTEFALAQALWIQSTARDRRARALDLAASARDGFGTQRPHDRQRVDDWMAGRTLDAAPSVAYPRQRRGRRIISSAIRQESTATATSP